MPPLELRLRILCAEPLSGALVTVDGDERAFDGWSGLAGALEAVLTWEAQAASAAASPARPGTSSLP